MSTTEPDTGQPPPPTLKTTKHKQPYYYRHRLAQRNSDDEDHRLLDQLIYLNKLHARDMHRSKIDEYAAADAAYLEKLARERNTNRGKGDTTEAFNTLTATIHKDAAFQPLTSAVMNKEDEAREINPHICSDKTNQEMLSAYGIPTPHTQLTRHAHPAHVAIERFLLKRILPAHATSYTALWMKESKATAAPKCKASFNIRFSAKDETRYQVDVGALPLDLRTPELLIHDAGHYVPLAAYDQLFRRFSNLERIFVTLICPHEIRDREPSYQPSLYELTYSGGNFKYHLEGKHADWYEQNIEATLALTNAHTIDGHSVKRLESIAAHHLYLITRATAKTHETSDYFDVPAGVVLPQADNSQYSRRDRTIPKAMYDEQVLHGAHLKTYEIGQATAKYRTSRKTNTDWMTRRAGHYLTHYSTLYRDWHRDNTLVFRTPWQRLLARAHNALATRRTRSALAAISTVGPALAIFRLVMASYSWFEHKLNWTWNDALTEAMISQGLIERDWIATGSRWLRTSTVASYVSYRRTALHFPPSDIDVSDLQQAISEREPLFRTTLAMPWRWLAISALAAVTLYAIFQETEAERHARLTQLMSVEKLHITWDLRSVTTSKKQVYDEAPPRRPSQPNENTPSKPSNVENSSSEKPPPSKTPEAHEPEPRPDAAQRNLQLILDQLYPPPPTPKPEAPKPKPPPTTPTSSSKALTAPQPEKTAHGPTTRRPLPDPLEAMHSFYENTLPLSRILDVGGDELWHDDDIPRGGKAVPLPKLNRCGIHALHDVTGDSLATIEQGLARIYNSEYLAYLLNAGGLSTKELGAYLASRDLQCQIKPVDTGRAYMIGARKGTRVATILASPDHFFNSIDNPNGGTFQGKAVSRWDAPAPKFSHKAFEAALKRFKVTEDSSDVYVPIVGFSKFRPSFGRAKRYASDLKNGFTGLMLSKEPYRSTRRAEAIDSLADNAQQAWGNRAAHATTILGYNGCGKTYPLVRFLKENPGWLAHVKIAVPNTELRQQWITDLELPAHLVYRVGTFESAALGEKTAKILIVDEISKMPRGYASLAFIVDAALETAIFLGDVTQMDFHEHNTESTAARLKGSEADFVKQYADLYLAYTKRSCQRVAETFGIQTTNKRRGFIRRVLCPPEKMQEYTWSTEKARSGSSAGKLMRTVASAQGQTVEGPIAIELDTAFIANATPKVLNMILNRTKTGVYFHGPDSPIIASALTSNPLLSAILNQQQTNIREMFADELEGLRILAEPIGSKEAFDALAEEIRAERRDRHKARGSIMDPVIRRLATTSALDSMAMSIKLEKLKRVQQGAEMTKSQKQRSREKQKRLRRNIAKQAAHEQQLEQNDTSWMPELMDRHNTHIRAERPTEDSPREEEPREETIRTHYPARDLMDWAYAQLPAEAAEDREGTLPDGTRTQQIRTTSKTDPEPIPLVSFAPYHDAKRDPTLLAFSAKKRLPRGSPFTNEKELNEAALPARLMFEAYQTARNLPLDMPEPLDEFLMEECIEENERMKATSKPRAFIIAHGNERNEPDEPLTRFKVFMKTQQKVKAAMLKLIAGELPRNPAKAGQTITQINEYVLYLLGPWVRYITKKQHATQPKHVFCLAGQTHETAAKWSRTAFAAWLETTGQADEDEIPCTTNDYTQFDQSQGGEAVAFELMIMEYYSVPEHIRNFYRWLKVNADTQLWQIRIMRFTGEAGTYKFNTMFNEAILNLQYDLAGYWYAVSGDDSLILGTPRESARWKHIKHLFRIEAKTEVLKQPEFCGFLYSRFGIVREPKHFAMKLAIATAEGKFWNVAMSYAQEAAVGRALGDNLRKILSEDQLEAHFALCHHLWNYGGPRVHAVLSTLPESTNEPVHMGKLARYARRLQEHGPIAFKDYDRQLRRGSSEAITHTPAQPQPQSTMSTRNVSHANCTFPARVVAPGQGFPCTIVQGLEHRQPRRGPPTRTAPTSSAPPPAPTPRAPAPQSSRNLNGSGGILDTFRVVVSAAANMSVSQQVRMDQTQQRIARAFQSHGRITAESVTISLHEGFAASETGSVTLELCADTVSTRSADEMIENLGHAFSAGANAPLVENFQRQVDGFSRVLHNGQRSNGAPGFRLFYQNTSSTEKRIVLSFRVRLQRPLTIAAGAAAPPFVAPGAASIGTAPSAREIGNGLVEILVPAGGATGRDGANFRTRAPSGNWTPLQLGGAQATETSHPGLRSLFPSAGQIWAAGLRVVASSTA